MAMVTEMTTRKTTNLPPNVGHQASGKASSHTATELKPGKSVRWSFSSCFNAFHFLDHSEQVDINHFIEI